MKYIRFLVLILAITGAIFYAPVVIQNCFESKTPTKFQISVSTSLPKITNPLMYATPIPYIGPLPEMKQETDGIQTFIPMPIYDIHPSQYQSPS